MALVSEGVRMTICTIGYKSCKINVGGNNGVAHFPESWCKLLVQGTDVVLSNVDVKWTEGEVHFHATRADSKIYMCPSPARGEMTTVEVFSGLGGWTQAANAMGLEPVLLVDSNFLVASASAKKLGIECVTAKRYIELCLCNQQSSRYVIHDDACNPDTWVAFGLANAHIFLGSPPCPPWSTAGNAVGLQSDEGRAFRTVLRQAAKINMTMALVENVPGLPRHADYGDLIRDIESHGMKLVVHGAHACAKVLPVQRDRWLATFVHESVQVDRSLAYMANAISFADRAFAKVAICPTIKDADVMHVNMREDEKTDLMIPDAVLEKLGMFEYAPTWLRNRLNGVPCPSADQVLNARAVLDCQQFVGFMAMYGRQHLISDDLLRSKGLQTVLLRDQQGLRLISPWEMVAAMGYEAEVVLASDMSEAWKMAGLLHMRGCKCISHMS